MSYFLKVMTPTLPILYVSIIVTLAVSTTTTSTTMLLIVSTAAPSDMSTTVTLSM